MTGKERLLAATKGEKVDRVPLWLREGFPLPENLANENNFLNCWQADKLYRKLYNELAPYADFRQGWNLGKLLNRNLMIPPEYIITTNEYIINDGQKKIIKGYIDTPKGKLNFTNEQIRGQATIWFVEDPVKSIHDLLAMKEIPFSFNPDKLKPCINNYQKAYNAVGDRGVTVLSISSPIVVISGCMPLELFLELSLTEEPLFHTLLEEITNRILTVLKALFDNYNIDAIVNIGGCEQCTPPLMAKDAFDRYVVPYDGEIIKYLKSKGLPVNIHCHGKVKHALKCMVDMGADSTDPVEPPPAGDLTIAETVSIAGDNLTLVGNLEFSELENADRSYIKARVNELMSFKCNRIILGASAGPISRVTEKLADNYRAMLEAYLENI